ncbi:MAG: YegP family protein [Chthoniobacteraceae bacterium]
MYYQVFQSGPYWYWHLKAANNEIVAASEGYTSKQNCVHAVNLVKSSGAAPVYSS